MSGRGPTATLQAWGHACFDLAADGAPAIRFDPFAAGALGGRVRLPAPPPGPSIVAVTHFHEDHADPTALRRARVVIDGDAAPAPGLRVRGRPLPHDAEGGARMGWVTALRVEAGAFVVVHLGDLGAGLTAADVEALSGAHVVLVPAGGTFTLDAGAAVEAALALGARWVVPMHVADPDIDLPLAPLEAFLEAWAPRPVRWPLGPSELLELAALPDEPTALLLRRAGAPGVGSPWRER